MATFPESTVCLICFQKTGNNIFVPADTSGNILKNCNTYFHSTLTKDALKDIQRKNKNQLLMCKGCFDSALKLIKLSEQLLTLRKEIADLSAELSLTVFHRPSQVCKSPTHNNSECVNKSSIIELKVSCLPSNLFFTNDEDKNTQPSCDENDQNIVIDDSSDESFTEESQDNNSNLHNLEIPTDSSSDSEVTIIETTGNNERVDSNTLKNVNEPTTSDLKKPVKTPPLNIESTNVTRPKASTSSTCSYQKKSDPRQQLLLKTKDKVNEHSNSDCTTNNSSVKKRFKCFHCEKTFNRSCDRKLHNITHTGEKPYTCSFCNKRFARKEGLRIHEKNHSGEKPHVCSFCDKRFVERARLKSHERIHTGEKPYECTFCKKRFTAHSILKCHKRTHTGEKPYKCSHCDKKFAQISTRNSHEKNHHKQLSSLNCSFCNRECTSFAHLKFHEKTHFIRGVLRIKCSFCELMFTKDEHRIVHENKCTSNKTNSL